MAAKHIESRLTKLRSTDTPLSQDLAVKVSLPDFLARAAGGALLDIVLDQAPPFWVAGSKSRLLFANRAYHDIAGNRIIPGQESAIDEILAGSGPVTRAEKTVVGGKTRHFRAYLFPIPGHGRPPDAVGGVLQDATTELQALTQARGEKQRLHDILRSTSDWVWETDSAGRLTFVSNRVTDLLGVPAALLHGKTLVELGRFGTADDDKPNGSGGALAMNVHQPFRDVAYAMTAYLGEVHSFSLSGVPVYSDTGAFVGYRGTATDVTERLAAETALRRYQAKLEHALESLHNNNLELDIALQRARAASESKSEFLATMSHELRTPLNAIIGFSELMTSGAFGALNERYSSYAGDIMNAGQHLLSMIEDILDLARIENGQIKLNCQPMAPHDLIGEATALVRIRAAEKKIALSIPETAPRRPIDVDRTRALQILVNLLGNSVKFTPNGGRVGIDLVGEGNHLAVAIWDTGPGVAPEMREKIFEKFQQAHGNILQRRHEGIGVGLALSRELARAMGGDVRLDQTSPRGSRFVVTFPLA